jgi:hypothetical protein
MINSNFLIISPSTVLLSLRRRRTETAETSFVMEGEGC